ncbi:MAG: adenylate/guanylate cyclase domain-containing protein [Ilumatobacteraceae bacterium]
MVAGDTRLPSGTVTFVFTDIEGSTRLIRSLGDEYATALDRHREILRHEWRGHGGHEVDTEGDSFFVVFASSTDAVVACADGQIALGAEPWPAEAPLRVRMGIHSGVAIPHGGDYVAFAVHQAARVVNTAHGGQIVVSADAAHDVELPPHLSLRSLGRYRVRDFDEPVELWQLHGVGLEETFPALRVLPADRHNLATPLTSIIGRDAELDHLAQIAQPSKAVTIVGPGGVGKTRLAVEHGLRSLDAWPDCVWFVDLAALDDGGLVPAAIAGALGVQTSADSDAIADIVGHLAGKHALLILDNAEHVREATAWVVASILSSSPGVGLLCTSREPLGLRAETVLRLGPLPWDGPVESDGSPRAAVQLFVERAAEAGATRRDSLAAVEKLCQRLDGLPLAIEMAAARASVLTPNEILSGLDDAARSFVSRDPTLPERHHSLDDLLAWSDRLLSETERSTLRCLAVFLAAFGYETAAAAVPTDVANAHLIPDLVWSLANKSLLNIDAAAGGTRFRFPETVRTFARRHDPAADIASAARRLATWYIDRLGPTCALNRGWVARMGEEIDNLRGLISLLANDDPSTAQQLAWSIGQYHDLLQSYRHGIEEVARHAVQLDEPTPSRVGLLTLLADLRLRVGEIDLAASTLAAAKKLQHEVGPPPWDEVAVERTEGELDLRSGDHERAARLAVKVLQRSLPDRGQGRMWNLLGIARFAGGDHAGAAAAFEFELGAWQRLGLEALQVSAHGNIAESLLTFGDRRGAAHHQRQCLQLALRYGQPLMTVYSLMVAARLAADDALWATAVRLQIAADEQLALIGSMMYAADRQAADAVLAEAAAHLGHDEFENEQRRGRSDQFDSFLTLADNLFANVESERKETHA